LGLDAGRGRAGPLEDDAHLRGRPGGLIGGLLGLGDALLALQKTLAEAAHFGLLRRQLTERARLFVRELLDLAANLGAERAAAPLERFELSGVAPDPPLAPAGRGRRGPPPPPRRPPVGP